MASTGRPCLSWIQGRPSRPYRDIWNQFTDVCSKHGDRIALISSGSTKPAPSVSPSPGKQTDSHDLTYKEFLDQVKVVGASLQLYGAKPKYRIATLLNNGLESPLLLWASIGLHATFIPLNPALISSKDELQHSLALVKPDLVILACQNDLEKVAATTDTHAVLKTVWDLWSSNCPPNATTNVSSQQPLPTELETSPPAADFPTICFLTSGTTSFSKGCVLTRSNLAAAIESHQIPRDIHPGDILCQHMPQHHSYGLSMTLAFFTAGGTVVFPDAKFNASSTVDAIAKHHCTHFTAVPTMVHAIADYLTTSSRTLDTLRSIDVGGTVVQADVLELCRTTIGAGHATASYGMTECCASLAFGEDELAKTPVPAFNEIASVGYPNPSVSVKVCSPESRNALPLGEEGMLHVCGPAVIDSYMEGRDAETFYHGSYPINTQRLLFQARS